MAKIHVMTHTHWDRDWFLPQEFINEWLDELFDRLMPLIEAVPDYAYVIDGQTSIIDDYLERHPERYAAIKAKAEAGNLLLGPYYGQIDWRVVGEESLMRNLYIGMRDARRYGNCMPCGWVIDNFGHCSQSPQIHALFGIEDVFLWRGPVFENDEIRSAFQWQGGDGTRLRGHYLLSGYRNFYNLTDTPEFLDARIDQMKRLLGPYSPSDKLIFLDGYDIDVWPEDPFEFLPTGGEFVRSSPQEFANDFRNDPGPEPLPVVTGELYSGKYACVFPGSLSARNYLRLQNALVERVLAYHLEPLQCLVAAAGVDVDTEATFQMWKRLVGTQLHDCIGGVSVDQVHDHTEVTYRELYDQATAAVKASLAYLPGLLDLEKGAYAFTPSPYEYDQMWALEEGRVYGLQPEGCGVSPLEGPFEPPAAVPLEGRFEWQNDHYTFTADVGGCMLNGKSIGRLLLERDEGDTYNADPMPFDPTPETKIVAMSVSEDPSGYAVIYLEREVGQGEIRIATREEIFLNQSPQVEWRLEVDSRGSDFRLRICYDTKDTASPVFAKMPYDINERSRMDTNYFGREAPEGLKPVLLAARELGSVKEFPFQGLVALAEADHTRSVFARGLREYEVDLDGTIAVTLRRSVQWLAKSDLTTRVGDAGPYMYTPGARDQRQATFELSFVDLEAPLHSEAFLKWFYWFEYGFIGFKNRGHDGSRRSERIWKERLPWSGIQAVDGGRYLIRVYNPLKKTVPLAQPHPGTDPFGREEAKVAALAPKQVAHLVFEGVGRSAAVSTVDVDLMIWPNWPTEADVQPHEAARLTELKEKIGNFEVERTTAREALKGLDPEADPLVYHRTRHKEVCLDREILELELSILLNRFKFDAKDEAEKAELRDRIRVVGNQTNLARRHRRTYDYILNLFDYPSDAKPPPRCHTRPRSPHTPIIEP